MQAPALPVVARSGAPAQDRNYDAIQTAFRRLGKLVAPVVNQTTTFNVSSSTVTEGLQQPGVQIVTTMAGVVPVPKSNTLVVTVDSGGQVIGIRLLGMRSGTFLRMTFLNACIIRSMAAVPAGVSPFLLGSVSGTPYDIDWTEPAPQAGGRIGVVYYASELPSSPCFQLVEGPTI